MNQDVYSAPESKLEVAKEGYLSPAKAIGYSVLIDILGTWVLGILFGIAYAIFV